MPETRPPMDEAPEPDEAGTGSPLRIIGEELAGPPPPRFLATIRDRIHRRAVAGNVLDFAGRGLAQVMLQWLLMLLGLFGPPMKTSSEDRDE